MNKQEFQQNIKDMKPTNYINSINSINSITIYDAYNEGFEEAKQNVLFGSDFLDEPEKPAVPQYVADMIIEKKKKYGIVDVIKNLGVFNNPFDLVVEKQLNWIVENQEDFVKAWLYGYEVEKEKLYRAKNRHTGEYLCYCFEFYHDKNSSSENQRFTAEEKHWKELGYWGNDLYAFEEAEGED